MGLKQTSILKSFRMTYFRRLCQMLFASRLSTTPTLSLIRYAIFGQTGPPRPIDYLAPLWECRRKVSPKDYDMLPNSGTEPGADDLAVANLCSYPLSCTVGMTVLSVFPKDTTARYALYGYRTSNLTITIQGSNRLNHTASVYETSSLELLFLLWHHH